MKDKRQQQSLHTGNQMNHEINVTRTSGKKYPLPDALRQVKENVCNILINQVTDMFSSCDDLFFDLSGRAASNAEQNLYFESMRDVRLKKGGVIASFKQEIENLFNLLAGPGEAKKDHYTQDISAGSLSLIENDQLEQKVAISSMASKARSQCQEELYHLNCRFDYLIQHKTVNETNNPLDPELICEAFVNAGQILELNIKARIILLKQFDRFIIAKLPQVYAQANQMLINANVLPKISAGIKKQTSGSTAAGGSAGQQAGANQAHAASGPSGTSQTGASFADLYALLGSLRSTGVSIPSIVALVPGYSQQAPHFAKDELLQSLNQVSSSNIQAVVGANAAPDIRSAVKYILLNSEQRGQPRSIDPRDEDIINLVAMFFDFVLDDPNLPVPVQAQISRLQIPILKTALHDKSFFSNNKHPARCLINEIASASVGWSEAEKHIQDKLFDEIAEVVQNIHDNAGTDVGIYAAMLEHLRSYLEKENRKSGLVEKRVSEAAVGKAKTDFARGVIRNILDERVANKTLPKPVYEFLYDQWQSVLFLVHLKEGEDSPQWLEALQVVDDLIWSSQQHTDEKSVRRLEQLLPKQSERINKYLKQTSGSPGDAEAATAEIETILTKILNQDISGIELHKPETTNTGKSDSPASGAEADTQATPGTAIDRQKAQQKQLEYKYIKLAENLPINSWIEIEDNGRYIRCKLTAKVEVSDSFIFVNRFGSRVLEKQRRQFAYDLQTKSARVLDKGPIFERTLTRIGENLRGLSA